MSTEVVTTPSWPQIRASRCNPSQTPRAAQLAVVFDDISLSETLYPMRQKIRRRRVTGGEMPYSLG
jgi:hypothetical protein